jgi:hypothetical protein
MKERYIARGRAVAARELGGEVIIMSAADSTLFNLNETATAIWRAADGRTPLSDIVELHICHEFDVEPQEADRDAVELVEDLAGYGILQLSDKPIVEAALDAAKAS